MEGFPLYSLLRKTGTAIAALLGLAGTLSLQATPEVTKITVAQREEADIADVAFVLEEEETGKKIAVTVAVPNFGGKVEGVSVMLPSGQVDSPKAPAESAPAPRPENPLAQSSKPGRPPAPGAPPASEQSRDEEAGFPEGWEDLLSAEAQTGEEPPAAQPPGLDIPEDMLLIPTGRFLMGNHSSVNRDPEQPVHAVFVRGVYIGKYEVSKALWDKVLLWAIEHGYRFENQGTGRSGNHPIHSISWYDAIKWANARSEMEDRTAVYRMDATHKNIYRQGKLNIQNGWFKWFADGYRLPTEAEWEKAVRGNLIGSEYPWPDREDIGYRSTKMTGEDANYVRSGDKYELGTYPLTTPAGYYPPNSSGLYDMVGNISEWVWDWYDADYYSHPRAQNSPKGPRNPENANRVVRGGSWADLPEKLRCSYRHWRLPGGKSDTVGFRLAIHQPKSEDETEQTKD